MNRTDLERWLDGYREAWRTDDPEQVAALFTEDATYLPSPFSKPWTGRQAIVERWIEHGDSQVEWQFESEILAVEDETGVVRGLTTYAATADGPETIYSNIWVIRLAADGRARSFTDWWVERPQPSE
jgi:uncharacterized protein (TIGR02246 family)